MGRFRKITVKVMLMVTCALMLFSMSVHILYTETLPTVPEPDTGRTQRISVNHGFVRYGTERQAEIFDAANSSIFLACLIGVTAMM